MFSVPDLRSMKLHPACRVAVETSTRTRFWVDGQNTARCQVMRMLAVTVEAAAIRCWSCCFVTQTLLIWASCQQSSSPQVTPVLHPLKPSSVTQCSQKEQEMSQSERHWYVSFSKSVYSEWSFSRLQFMTGSSFYHKIWFGKLISWMFSHVSWVWCRWLKICNESALFFRYKFNNHSVFFFPTLIWIKLWC